MPRDIVTEVRTDDLDPLLQNLIDSVERVVGGAGDRDVVEMMQGAAATVLAATRILEAPFKDPQVTEAPGVWQ